MPVAAKTALLCRCLLNKSIFLKIIEGEMFVEIEVTSALQLFCEPELHSSLIIKSVMDSGDTCPREFYA